MAILFSLVLAALFYRDTMATTSVILVEDAGQTENLDLNTSFQFQQVNLEFLGGRNCEVYSVYGSVLVSGVELISRFLSSQNTTEQELIGIISQKCTRESLIIHYLLKKVSLANKTEANIPIVSINPSYISYYGDSNLFHMLPPVYHLIDSFLTVCQAHNWDRIGIITNTMDRNLEVMSNYMKHSLQRRKIVSWFWDLAKVKKIETKTYVLNRLIASRIKIIFLAMPPNQTTKILCEAFSNNLRWPQYAWVVYLDPSSTHKFKYPCSQIDLEGVVYLTYEFNFKMENSHPSVLHSLNLQRALLQDGIQFIKLARNESGDIASAVRKMNCGDLKEGQYCNRNILFVQVKQGRLIIAARLRSGKTIFNYWLFYKEKLPTTRLPLEINTLYPLWLNIVEVILCTFAITTVLILFVYYRKEPEIKATSWLLCLFMILSCYLVAVNLLTNTLHISTSPAPHFNICIFFLWISGYGIPQPLIMAVLLVKMLRVYHIFNYTFSKFGKISSDYAMAFFILLLLTPFISILTVATALNRYHWTAVHSIKEGYIEVTHECQGDLTTFFQVLLAYQVILIFFTTSVAWTTRKLRMKHFRDAKKVNGFILTFLLTAVPGSALYGIFRAMDQQVQAYIIIHVCYNVFIYSCLGFLFVPKIYPVMKRSFNR